MFPIVGALGLSGVTGIADPVARAKYYLILATSHASAKKDSRTPIEVCEDLANGVDRLKAEFSVSYLIPQSEQDISNLYILADIQNKRDLSPETTALATRAQTMIKDYFALAGSDPQNSEVRKAMLMNSLTSLIGDLSTTVRRDCKTVITPALPEQAPNTSH